MRWTHIFVPIVLALFAYSVLPSAYTMIVNPILACLFGYFVGSYKLLSWIRFAISCVGSRNGGYINLSHTFLNLEETGSWMNLGLWQRVKFGHHRKDNTMTNNDNLEDEEIKLSEHERQNHARSHVQSNSVTAEADNLFVEPRRTLQNITYSPVPTYAAACRALALLLGRASDLSKNDVVLDVGFGRGDQLFLWRDEFKVRRVHGVNSSLVEVKHFQAREQLEKRKYSMNDSRADLLPQSLQTKGENKEYFSFDMVVSKKIQQDLTKGTIETFFGSATVLSPSLKNTFDKVLALDCAYHFAPCREKFFREAFRVLKPGGRLALTDVIPMCNLNTLSLWRRLLLRAAFFISGIPADNIFGAHLEGYKNSLQRAGIIITDISAAVFPGFANFMSQHCRNFENICVPGGPTGHISFQRLKMAGKVAQWAFKSRTIQFVLVTADKSATRL